MKRTAESGKETAKRAAGLRRKGELMRKAELPADIVPSYPCMTIEGDAHILVKNAEGILELKTTVIRLYTGLGILRIEGERLGIRCMGLEKTQIDGCINAVIFEKNSKKR